MKYLEIEVSGLFTLNVINLQPSNICQCEHGNQMFSLHCKKTGEGREVYLGGQGPQLLLWDVILLYSAENCYKRLLQMLGI